jgi:lipid-binding SYLF domain-containing protein
VLAIKQLLSIAPLDKSTMSSTAPADETKRPSYTSMEGMIWNANHVLEQALKPGIQGLPKNLFEECLGVVMVSIIEAGFIFSANVGTGIVLLKQADGTFSRSPPCAVGLTGVGFGLLAGASVKDVVMFLMDQQTVNSVTSENGLKIGSQVELTLGVGRTGKGDFDITSRGVGVPISIAYTKGVFGGFNLEGAVLGARHAANKAFYDKTTSPREILVEKSVSVPADKVTMLPEVYDKLAKLSAGVQAEPSPAEQEKKSVAASAAEKAAESVHAEAGSEVVHVDAAAEAAKEASA